MKRFTTVLIGLAFVAPLLAAQAQTPRILNGRVEARTGGAIDREVAAASPSASTNPVWVAWRAPLIKGDRDMCGWYVDQQYAVRGSFLEDGIRNSNLDVRTSALATPPT